VYVSLSSEIFQDSARSGTISRVELSLFTNYIHLYAAKHMPMLRAIFPNNFSMLGTSQELSRI